MTSKVFAIFRRDLFDWKFFTLVISHADESLFFIKHLLFFFFPFTQACPKWSLSSFSISFLFQNNRSNRIRNLFRLEINLLDSSFLFCSHFSNCIFIFVRQLSETQNQSFNASSSSLLLFFCLVCAKCLERKLKKKRENKSH